MTTDPATQGAEVMARAAMLLQDGEQQGLWSRADDPKVNAGFAVGAVVRALGIPEHIALEYAFDHEAELRPIADTVLAFYESEILTADVERGGVL